MSNPPTPADDLSESGWSPARGDELITINTDALSKLMSISIGRPDMGKLLVVGVAAVAIVLGVFAQKQLAEERNETAGLLLWAAAISVFLGAVWQARAVRFRTAEAANVVAPKARAMPLALEATLFGLALATAAFFRFFRIDDIPPGLNHDAAFIGLYGIKIHQGTGYTPYVTHGFSGESMFHYMVAGSQYVWGYTEFAIQFAAIMVGLATVVAFYFFVRRLFDARLALVATFLLALSGWHFTLSKVGWPAILVPLFVCVTFSYLVKAVQERQTRDFVLAGVFLGLSLDTYNGARILPFIAGAYLLYEIVRDRSLVQTHRAQLALFGAATFVTFFAVLGWWAVPHWDQYTQRADTLWIGDQIDKQGSLEPLFANIKDALLLFNFKANGNDFFVREPLLDMPVSVFFTLGLAIALLRCRQRPYFLLLAMLFLTLVVGVVSKPNGNRNIAAVVPVTALAAVFLYEAWRWLCDTYPRQQPVFSLGLAAVLIFAGWASYDSYLGPDRRAQWGFYPETTVVGRYMDGIADEYEMHVAAGNWPRDALTYLSYAGGDPLRQHYSYTTNTPDLLAVPAASDRGTAFIVEASEANVAVVNGLQQRFPGALLEAIYFDRDAERLTTCPAKAQRHREDAIACAVLVPPGGGPGGIVDATTVIPEAKQRDDDRRNDLARIKTALTAYKQRTGSYPDTSSHPQTACVYRTIDALCQFAPEIGDDALADPRGDPGKYGYWYASDGTTFAVYATMEGTLAPEEACKLPHEGLANQPNLYCVRGE